MKKNFKNHSDIFSINLLIAASNGFNCIRFESSFINF